MYFTMVIDIPVNTGIDRNMNSLLMSFIHAYFKQISEVHWLHKRVATYAPGVFAD